MVARKTGKAMAVAAGDDMQCALSEPRIGTPYRCWERDGILSRESSSTIQQYVNQPIELRLPIARTSSTEVMFLYQMVGKRPVLPRFGGRNIRTGLETMRYRNSSKACMYYRGKA